MTDPNHAFKNRHKKQKEWIDRYNFRCNRCNNIGTVDKHVWDNIITHEAVRCPECRREGYIVII